jgi:hypothetical protein
MPLAAALNAPPLHGFSPVRRLRAGLPLAPLRFSPPHKSPPPDAAHRAGIACGVLRQPSQHRQSRGRVCVGSDIARR